MINFMSKSQAGTLFKQLRRLGAWVHAVLGVAFIVRMHPRDPTILPGDTLRRRPAESQGRSPEVGVSQPIYLQMATGRETFEWFGS